eukprot:4378354-Pyramimonas_sp.AAC.1
MLLPRAHGRDLRHLRRDVVARHRTTEARAPPRSAGTESGYPPPEGAGRGRRRPTARHPRF